MSQLIRPRNLPRGLPGMSLEVVFLGPSTLAVRTLIGTRLSRRRRGDATLGRRFVPIHWGRLWRTRDGRSPCQILSQCLMVCEEELPVPVQTRVLRHRGVERDTRALSLQELSRIRPIRRSQHVWVPMGIPRWSRTTELYGWVLKVRVVIGDSAGANSEPGPADLRSWLREPDASSINDDGAPKESG